MDKEAVNSIGYVSSSSNDVYSSTQGCFILSKPFGDGHGWSITPDNFEQSLQVLAIRKLVKQNWLNDNNQYHQPDITIDGCKQWLIDCIVYSLFNGAMISASATGLIYKDRSWDINNHFFWLTNRAFQDTPNLSRVLFQDNRQSNHDPYAATWLLDNRREVSNTARDVLLVARVMVIDTLQYRAMASKKYHLDRWDAGWYQIRMGILKSDLVDLTSTTTELYNDFKAKYKLLEDELRPGVYKYGCLDE